LELLEWGKVIHIPRDEDEVMHERNGCDLTVEERRGSARPGEPSPFARMTLRGSCVIGKDDERGGKGLPQVFLDRSAPLRLGKTVATVEKL
jgi:hypothetical protein